MNFRALTHGNAKSTDARISAPPTLCACVAALRSLEKQGAADVYGGWMDQTRQSGARRIILGVLLAAVAVAALTGLIILFVGAGDVAGRVLGSIFVIAAGALVALPGSLLRWGYLRLVYWVLVAVDVVLLWVVIWSGDVPSAALVKVMGTIAVLVVFTGVSIAAVRSWTSHPTRWALACLVVGLVSGFILAWMAWLMTWSDGGIGIPARVIAGTAIIYAASSLASGLIALLGGYTIVRRDALPPGER